MLAHCHPAEIGELVAKLRRHGQETSHPASYMYGQDKHSLYWHSPMYDNTQGPVFNKKLYIFALSWTKTDAI